ncbi:MAG: transposase [Cyanobacteriota bacterium]|nr:transposase [Cyanobacteriota bacterium]
MYRTVPIHTRFTDEEQAYWLDQCYHANALTNCAVYLIRQQHYELLDKNDAYGVYWSKDELRWNWQTWYCRFGSHAELCKELKDNVHYKALAAQSAQQVLKSVSESVISYNKLVKLYYSGDLNGKPKLVKYRKKGLNAVAFPRQALTYREGSFYPSISRGAKDDVIGSIHLTPPDFVDPDWVKEVTIRPSQGTFWVDWVIDDGVEPIVNNPKLDYSQAIGFDHGGCNWLTAVTTQGKSFIIDGRKPRSYLQGHARLLAKYKQGKSEFYWDETLDRVQFKRNNQMRDVINKTARFIINYCLSHCIGNIIFGWNEGQKNQSKMTKQNNQTFVAMPTKRMIDRVKQLAEEYGIRVTLTEEAYTSKASYLDNDPLPKHGEKPSTLKFSGRRVCRGMSKASNGKLINADCNGAANILRKVKTQLGLDLAKVIGGILMAPHRYDMYSRLSKLYRQTALRNVPSGTEVTTV